MEIRLYTDSDKPALIKLMSEFGRYLENIDPLHHTEFAPGGAEYYTDKLIQETTRQHGAIFVAVDNLHHLGFVGGYVGQQTEEEQREAKPATPGIISEFFITESARRAGTGSQLMRQMEQHLKNQGCTIIRIEVFAPNTAARRFYAQHGYVDRNITISKTI